MIYINEAHAADGRRPVPYAEEKGIKEHASYGERCTTAQMLLEDRQLTVPCLIDGMDNAVNEQYKAWPDRLFVVRTDGRLAVAAARGPRGFKPALEAAEQWLSNFKTSGQEPELPARQEDVEPKDSTRR